MNIFRKSIQRNTRIENKTNEKFHLEKKFVYWTLWFIEFCQLWSTYSTLSLIEGEQRIFSDYFEHIKNLNSIITVQSECVLCDTIFGYLNYWYRVKSANEWQNKRNWEKNRNLSAKTKRCVIIIAVFVEQNDYWGNIIVSAKTVCSSAAIKRPRTKYGLK